MTDVSHPDTPSEEDGIATPNAGPKTTVHSFARLGEGSIHLFILFAGAALITPLGNFPPLTVLFGLMVFGFGVQLVLRLPQVSLPDLFQDALEASAPGQWVLGQIKRHADTLESFQRRQPHWMMTSPFDIFPRVLVATGGLVAVVSSSVPGMAHVLGVAAILISVSLLARNISIFFLGAALLSWSSVLPLLSR